MHEYLHGSQYLVKQVCGLHQLRSQGVKKNIWSLQLPVIPLRKSSKSLPNGIVKSVQADRILHIPTEHLRNEDRFSEAARLCPSGEQCNYIHSTYHFFWIKAYAKL